MEAEKREAEEAARAIEAAEAAARAAQEELERRVYEVCGRTLGGPTPTLPWRVS